MRCKYCNNEAEWSDPINNRYMCDECALIEFNKIKLGSNNGDYDTIKDAFLKITKPDKNLINLTLNTKTGEVFHADSNW